MTNRIEIAFSIQGWNKQEIEVADGIDPQHLYEMLERGEAFTTLQGGGEVLTLRDGHLITLGTVVSNDLDTEYFDFELKNTWEE